MVDYYRKLRSSLQFTVQSSIKQRCTHVQTFFAFYSCCRWISNADYQYKYTYNYTLEVIKSCSTSFNRVDFVDEIMYTAYNTESLTLIIIATMDEITVGDSFSLNGTCHDDKVVYRVSIDYVIKEKFYFGSMQKSFKTWRYFHKNRRFKHIVAWTQINRLTIASFCIWQSLGPIDCVLQSYLRSAYTL